jgi:hypothetical protein
MVAISADTATISQLYRNDMARIFQLWDLAVISMGYKHDFLKVFLSIGNRQLNLPIASGKQNKKGPLNNQRAFYIF